MTRFDDETLMAFADGRLDDETSAKVEAALGDDPAVAERVAALAEAGRLVRDLHRPLADLPVPPELVAKVRALAEKAAAPNGEVIDLSSRRERRSVRSMAWPMAMAASIAALVAGPIGYLIAGGGTVPSPGLAFSENLNPALAGALDTLSSGSETTLAGAGLVRAVATFRDADGQLCREFEMESDHALVAVACRSGEAWRIAFAVEAPLSGGFAPASSLAALDAYLDAVSAGQPLSAEEEAEVLAGGR